ncbi:MAG: threonine synthase [Bacteroidetes bacterium]|nr:threonine synthase [Bacteroidota bacterium]
MNSPLLFHSTNLKSEPLTFSQALLQGLAPDKGLYMPEYIPQISLEEISSFTEKPYYRIAFEVSRKFFTGEISDEELLSLVKDAYNYEVPLEKVYDRKYVMRLDQGPTASFKDFAARMMGRLMQYYLKKENRSLTILTATSGDTGSAVANAFYGLDNINIVVLFPKSEVTDRQRKQMTTLGRNVHILALDAKFDDCQALVKEAFTDPNLAGMNLSSANSINIGRLIPQTVYYFYAFAKLRNGNPEEKVVFSVPSGNFGDMMGGVIAFKMGLPVKKFVISTNENDEFPVYLQSGNYDKIEPSRNCISSAMNVGHPSNLARLVAMYGGVMDETGKIHKQADLELMRKEIYSVSISDIKTKETIENTYKNYNILLEPHGSVGWAGLMSYLEENPGDNTADQLCISLETAHPAKFPQEIQKILGIDPELPPSLLGLESKEESVINIESNYQNFKEYLLNTFK